MTIINDFIEFSKIQGYLPLEEVPLVRKEEDTFFIMSSIAAHIDLFKPGKHKSPAKYSTIQRVFSATRLDDAGKYPLANSFEIMMSIFRFQDDSALKAIDFVNKFLEKILNINQSEIIYIAPFELDLRKSVLQSGAQEKNVISWKRSIPLRLGKGRAGGEYVKLFLPYKHGLIPIATLGFLIVDNKLAIDSALFVERLEFVKKNIDHCYQDDYFAYLIKQIKNTPTLKELSFEEQHLWTHHLRALYMLLWDNVKASGKGPGHTIRKMTRQLSATLGGNEISKDDFKLLADAVKEVLMVANYDVGDRLTEISDELLTLINQGSKQIAKQISNFKKDLIKAPLTIEDVLRWQSERGLSINLMHKESLKINKEIPIPETPKKFWLRNESYSFDKTKIIKDPIEFLQIAETHRMKGIKS